MKNYVLVRTDGYSIETVMQSSNLDKVKETLCEDYKKHLPEEWVDDFEDMSCCGDMDAILYDNGENVYVWQIIEVKESVS